MPASRIWSVRMTLAEKGERDSGTSPKPATLALWLALLPVMVTVCAGSTARLVCGTDKPHDSAAAAARM
jgi:hypothetical protein